MAHLIHQAFGKAGKRRHRGGRKAYVTGRVARMISKVLVLGFRELGKTTGGGGGLGVHFAPKKALGQGHRV